MPASLRNRKSRLGDCLLYFLLGVDHRPYSFLPKPGTSVLQEETTEDSAQPSKSALPVLRESEERRDLAASAHMALEDPPLHVPHTGSEARVASVAAAKSCLDNSHLSLVTTSQS